MPKISDHGPKNSFVSNDHVAKNNFDSKNTFVAKISDSKFVPKDNSYQKMRIWKINEPDDYERRCVMSWNPPKYQKNDQKKYSPQKKYKNFRKNYKNDKLKIEEP